MKASVMDNTDNKAIHFLMNLGFGYPALGQFAFFHREYSSKDENYKKIFSPSITSTVNADKIKYLIEKNTGISTEIKDEIKVKKVINFQLITSFAEEEEYFSSILPGVLAELKNDETIDIPNNFDVYVYQGLENVKCLLLSVFYFPYKEQ